MKVIIPGTNSFSSSPNSVEPTMQHPATRCIPLCHMWGSNDLGAFFQSCTVALSICFCLPDMPVRPAVIFFPFGFTVCMLLDVCLFLDCCFCLLPWSKFIAEHCLFPDFTANPYMTFSILPATPSLSMLPRQLAVNVPISSLRSWLLLYMSAKCAP